MIKNARTGLSESLHDYYQVPEVQQRSIQNVRYGGQQTAVHKVPVGAGLTLDFYARLGGSDEILVSLHGALIPGRHKYPRFERVASLRSRAKAMMSFADPTIAADKRGEISSAWFLGGPGWDPQPWITQAIRKAFGKTGARHIAFVGGSGGGFAALRASAAVPGSLAFIQDPQTNLAVHNPVNVDKYFATMWPGWDKDSLLHAFPERFDMVRHYSSSRPKNYVYYAQNSRDTFHTTNHYLPFAEVHGMGSQVGLDRSNTRNFALYDGANRGHGKITAAEFDQHLALALAFWRENRPT